jgi:hypothetical protein
LPWWPHITSSKNWIAKSKGIEAFSFGRIIKVDPCLTMTAVPTWIQLFLLSLGIIIAINIIGVIFSVFETMQVLLS